MDARIEKALRDIASDNRSGAAEILARAVEVFSLLAAHDREKHATVERACRPVLEICAALVQAQPDMAPLANLASRVAVATAAATSADAVVNIAREAAIDFRNRAARAVADTTRHAADLIAEGATLLTHSRSSTVLAAFITARRQGRRFSVIATESRPLFEGRQLARELAAEGIEVTLIADAAAAVVMGRVDFVLVGADKITPDAVINKIGTTMIALAARERGIRIYAACDTSKFIRSPGLTFTEESRRPDELWPDAPDKIKVLNRYFEPTPLGLFTAIITEDGAVAPEEAAGMAS